MSSGLDHYPLETLADAAEGRLPPAERNLVEAHVAACAECADTLSWVRRVVSVMRSDDDVAVPAALHRRALDLFPGAAPRTRSEHGLGRRLLAALRFDSTVRQPAWGTRAGPVSARQLLFTAEQYDLDLRIRPTEALWQVSGQVLGPSTEGEVVLSSALEPEQRARVDEEGAFTLLPVTAGRYTLRLSMGEIDIEAPNLQVGDADSEAST